MGSSSFLSQIWESFSPENEDNPFDGDRYLQGFLLSDLPSEPVIRAEVFIDQVASHCSSSSAHPDNKTRAKVKTPKATWITSWFY
jgi:hypothetical protein